MDIFIPNMYERNLIFNVIIFSLMVTLILKGGNNMKRSFVRKFKRITALTLIFICTFLLIPISASAAHSSLTLTLEDEVKMDS